mmetsp:Transcript_20386/g.54447  ORF Transcript_20386/g.54447 Transcript_20386/m.54447 type:complete len:204 (+) Transcript_20386:89-700(+)
MTRICEKQLLSRWKDAASAGSSPAWNLAMSSTVDLFVAPSVCRDDKEKCLGKCNCARPCARDATEPPKIPACVTLAARFASDGEERGVFRLLATAASNSAIETETVTNEALQSAPISVAGGAPPKAAIAATDWRSAGTAFSGTPSALNATVAFSSASSFTLRGVVAGADATAGAVTSGMTRAGFFAGGSSGPTTDELNLATPC